MPIFLITAWTWIKNNWKWLLFPVGIVIFLIGKFGNRDLTVVNPELVEAEQVKDEAGKQARKEIEERAAERDQKLREISIEHLHTINTLTDEQREEAVRIQNDAEALNSYLHEVSKQVKGGK